MINPQRTLHLKILVSFAIIYFFWGATYLAIRFAIQTIPPFLMAGIRFTLAGSILYLWRSRTDRVNPRTPEIRKSILVGLLLIVGGNGVLVWCEQYLPSGLAALILAIIPIWMVLLDSIFVVKKRPASLTITGILLGVGGVALLSGVDRTVLLSTAGHQASVFFYPFILVLAGLSWAAGSLYSRTIISSASLLKLTGIQMLGGGLFMILLGSALGEWSQVHPENLSLRSVFSLIYLILFGSLLSYSAYNWVLRKSSPAKVGTYAFFNPLVAVFLGWLLAGETVTTKMLAGAACILSAVLFVNQSGYIRNIIQKISKNRLGL
ncbi:MAG: EamA family transporter [Calditrichota bacterium]